MANSQISINSYYKLEEASVDTDPGANGYGCKEIVFDKDRAIGQKLVFYISQIGTGAIVTLQWRRSGVSTWTDYESFSVVTRQIIEEQSYPTEWRAVVKDNNQGSAGASVFGISW